MEVNRIHVQFFLDFFVFLFGTFDVTSLLCSQAEEKILLRNRIVKEVKGLRCSCYVCWIDSKRKSYSVSRHNAFHIGFYCGITEIDIPRWKSERNAWAHNIQSSFPSICTGVEQYFHLKGFLVSFLWRTSFSVHCKCYQLIFTLSVLFYSEISLTFVKYLSLFSLRSVSIVLKKYEEFNMHFWTCFFIISRAFINF